MEKFGFFDRLPQASTVSGTVDGLFDFITIMSVIGFVLVVVALIFFVIKYNKNKVDPDKTPYMDGHTPSEVGVSILLTILVMVIFYWGWIGYKEMLVSPDDSLEVSVTGKMWVWDFEYNNGRKLGGRLVLPKDTPVRLVMTSNDVIHSFYVPSFRIKKDVVPGQYSTLNFTATEAGEFDIFCTEYCGTGHSAMLAKIEIVEADEYARWQLSWELAQRTGGQVAYALESEKKALAKSPAERGKDLYSQKACNTCHTLDGKALIGPSFLGLYGSERKFVDGSTAKADENYIRQSIEDPQSQIVEGFQAIMPTYKGTLTDDEITSLIAYIKTLKK